MPIHPILNHATLPDMPSATNTDHDGRYYTEAEVDAGFLAIDGSNANTTIDIGSEDFLTTGTGRFDGGLAVGRAPQANHIDIQTNDASDPSLHFITTNTAHEIQFFLDENAAADLLDICGETAGIDTQLRISAQDGQASELRFYSGGTNFGLIKYTSGDVLRIQNDKQDADLLFGIDDGGVTKTITWNASLDKLQHSAGTFNFDDDDITTTGTGQFSKLGISTAISPTTYLNVSPTADFILGRAISGTMINTRDGIVSGIFGLDFVPVWQPADITANRTAGNIVGVNVLPSATMPIGETFDMTITNFIGFNSKLSLQGNSATGTLRATNAMLFKADAIISLGGAKLTNLYAYYDGGQTAGDNNWSYYNAGGADNYFGLDNAKCMWGTTNTDLQIYSDGTNGIIDVATSLRLGNNVTNYTEISSTGDVVFAGTARINWTKITANGATIRNNHGTTGSAVSDLQTAHDGNFYTLSEESGETPAMDVEIDFTGVTAFNWVQILARYEQAVSSHGITVMLEITPFDGSAWHRYTYFTDQQADLTNEDHSFFVPDDSAYINSGVVKVRFVHEMGGTSSNHDLVIDVCVLYQ